MAAWQTQTNLNEKRTVLIVSQDSKMVSTWKTLFKQKNCCVVHETSPRHALQAARLISPALTILDLDLPQPERFSLCKQLRPLTRGAIFLIVPDVDEDEASEYYYAGVDERLPTTISPATLLAKSMLWLRIVPREKTAQVYA